MHSNTAKELVLKWQVQSLEPETANGSEDAKIGNAFDDGMRKGKAECAEDLKALIELLQP